MPWSGNGTFSRVYSWVTDQANGVLVRADRMDTDSNDIAAGITNCITRDGQAPATANIPFAGYIITGFGNGAADTDSVNFAQVFKNPAFQSMSATGTVNLSSATTVTAPTVAAGDSSTKVATTAFASALSFAAALPAQTGNAGKGVKTDGSVASWRPFVGDTGYSYNHFGGF
jgi:hypothetical protein